MVVGLQVILIGLNVYLLALFDLQVPHIKLFNLASWDLQVSEPMQGTIPLTMES